MSSSLAAKAEGSQSFLASVRQPRNRLSMAKALLCYGMFEVSRKPPSLASTLIRPQQPAIRINCEKWQKLLFLTVDFNCLIWSDIHVQEITFFLVPEPYEEVVNTRAPAPRWGSFSFAINSAQFLIHLKIASKQGLQRVVKAAQRHISPFAFGDSITLGV
jgi:hypothetical protein